MSNTKKVTMSLHEQLAQIRKESGLKQNDIAKVLGVSHSRISEYESGKREISIPTLRKWADACGYELNFYFSEK